MLGRVVLAVLVGLLVTAAPAAAASQKVRSYRVSEVRDLLDRTKVTVAGAAIVEVDHAEVVATANRRAVRRLRRAGFKVERMALVRKRLQRRGGARAADFPSADSAYHNYTEMTNETLAVVNDQPRRRSASSRASASAPRSRAARSGPSRSPTTSAPTRTSPRCCSPPTSTRAST